MLGSYHDSSVNTPQLFNSLVPNGILLAVQVWTVFVLARFRKSMIVVAESFKQLPETNLKREKRVRRGFITVVFILPALMYIAAIGFVIVTYIKDPTSFYFRREVTPNHGGFTFGRIIERVEYRQQSR